MGRHQGDGAKRNPLQLPPGIKAAIDVVHIMKTALPEGLPKSLFLPGAADAATPQRRILLKRPRHRTITDDVTDGDQAPGCQNTLNVAEQPIPSGGIHQIQNTVAQNHIDAGIRWGSLPLQGQHAGVPVHTRHPSISTDDLGTDEGVLATAAAEV